jgi:hypothetical protein
VRFVAGIVGIAFVQRAASFLLMLHRGVYAAAVLLLVA